MPELFYLPPESIRGESLTFPEEERRHIQKSCRKGEGDTVRVTDGRGHLMTVSISGSGRGMTGKVIERRLVAAEPCTVDLAVGISKRERMSWLVEKGTELGVTNFFPVITDWSRTRRHREGWEGHLERWTRVAISALKQSQRCYLPGIHQPCVLDDFLRDIGAVGYDLKILLDRGRESRPMGEFLRGGMSRFLVLLGPEGGFNEDEISRISGYGFTKGSLVQRPLRFETAGITSVALIITRFADRRSRRRSGKQKGGG